MLTVLAFLVVIGVLIFVHELGHFLAAKAVGVQVLRFSLGFGRPIFSWRRGETEYWISWLPIGGYVKMAGMEDEGVAGELEGGTGGVPVDPQRAFDKKPVWARLVVLIAGVTMNAAFAFFAFTGIAATVGTQEIATTRVDTVVVDQLPPGARSLARLHRGDRIVAVNGDTVSTWQGLLERLLFVPAPIRFHLDNGDSIVVDGIGGRGAESRLQLLAALRFYVPPVIGYLESGSPATRAGLQLGDTVIRARGDTVRSWEALRAVLRASPQDSLRLKVHRSGTVVDLTVVPERRTSGAGDSVVTFGYAGAGPEVPLSRRRFAPPAAAGEGWRQTVKTFGQVWISLKGLVTGEVPFRQLGGIIGIGQQSGEAVRSGFANFLAFMATLSVNLAILNLLPIPILDGGGLIFTLAEAVRRKPLPLKLRLQLTQVGLFLIIALMLLALSNDVLRIIRR